MATETKMSVTRGLAELKMLDKRITDAISKIQPFDIKIGEQTPVFLSARDLKETKDVETRITSSMQSLNDLIKRRAAINAAIVQSNATTTVEICGVEYTVATVIKMKDYIKTKRELSTRLKAMLNNFTREMDKQNKRVEDEIARRLTAVLSRDSEGSDTERQMVTDAVHRQMAPTLIDPLKITDMIQQLDDEVDEFETNVDYVLSESNARTEINVVVE